MKLLDRCRRLKKKPIAFITRLLRLDAALYEPAAPRKPGQMGRPRLKGSRLPNLSVVADDPKTVWIPITVSSCYGEGERTVEVVCETTLWYSTGFCPQCPCVGFDPRSRRRVRDPSSPLHRSRCRARADHLVVRKTLANGGHFPRGASAPRVRDTKALVGVGRP